MKHTTKTMVFATMIAAMSTSMTACAETPASKAMLTTSGGGRVTTFNRGDYNDAVNTFARAQKPGLNYWIELQRPGNPNLKRVPDSHVFKSGDKIRIHVAGNSSGNLYILHKGSSGYQTTFPSARDNSNKVSGGEFNVIPSNKGWLRFDSNKGTEELRLVFTPSGTSSPAPSSATGQQILAMYNEYSTSKGLKSAELPGSKDLIAENIPASVPVTSQASASASGQIAAAYQQPGRVVVNTAGDPVAVEIKLKHQ